MFATALHHITRKHDMPVPTLPVRCCRMFYRFKKALLVFVYSSGYTLPFAPKIQHSSNHPSINSKIKGCTYYVPMGSSRDDELIHMFNIRGVQSNAKGTMC